jgi:hypothetical protein
MLFMRSVRIAFFVRDESAEGKENLRGIFLLALSLVSWPLFFLSCPLAPLLLALDFLPSEPFAVF